MTTRSTNVKVKKTVEIALVSALYVVLTMVSASFGVAYLAVQLRFSEILTILPVISPSAIPALTIGCLIANMASPLGFIDILFGTLSTLIAAICTRLLRKIMFLGIPVLAPLPPVVVGAVFVGAMVSFSMPAGFTATAFWSTAFSVGLGQFIVCYGLGIPFLVMLKKKGILKNSKGKCIGEKYR